MVANVATTQITSAAFIVYIIERLKSANWFPLVEKGKVWANRIASLIGAALTALAINYAWSYNATNRQFVFSITIPTLSVFALAVFHWAQQFVLNEVLYQITANRSASPAPSAQKG